MINICLCVESRTCFYRACTYTSYKMHSENTILPLHKMALQTLLFAVLFTICPFAQTMAQSTVFTDNFSANTSATFTTSGAIGTAAWSVARSGNDWGARRNSNVLELSNDVSATNNSNGWVFASVPSGNLSCYAFVLNNNSGPLTWNFNMRQSQADPGGFGSSTFGAAFVLAGTDANVVSSGSGYAVVLGQTGTTDPIRLVHYNNGLRGTLTNIITSNTTGLTDFGAQYLSVRVVYNPSTDNWQLLLRNDGNSAFADPITGTLTTQGAATNSTYTSSSITAMGAYWQGGTTASQTAVFDNVTLTKAIAAPTVGAITQPTCTNSTGSVVLSGLPTTGNWLLTRNPGGTSLAGSGASTTISNLAPNTYTFTVSDYSYGYQATVSACGYTAVIVVEPLSIVSLDNPCTNGYNYNVEFNYTITVTGVNTCWDGDIGFQPQIFCNSQNNGNYTIRIPAPTVGAASSTRIFRGTLTTQTRPYNSNSDCATANIVNQNCNRVDVTIFGPGIASSTYPTTISTSSGCPSPSSANVVINAPASLSITTQPSNASVCGEATGNFTVAVSGTGSTYEWQRKPAGSGSWTAIGTIAGATGSTTANLSIANLESNGWNNYLVRAVVSQSGCTATSDSARITVSTAPTAPTSITSSSSVITTVPVVQSSATNTGSGNSITVNKPTGVQEGDLLLMGFTFEKGTGVTITPPTDWVLIARTDQSTNVGMASYYRIATSADVAASNFSFTVTNTPKWSVGLVRITGYNTSNPISASGGQSSGTSGTSVASPSVIGAAANGLGIAFYTNKKNALFTPANGTTEIYDSPNNTSGEPSNMMAYFAQTSAGTTVARTATASISERWAAQQIIISPKQTFVECTGNVIVLTANGGSNGSGSTYQWGTGSIGSNILAATGATVTVTALGSQQYWVRRVGNTGCTNTTGAVSANTEIRQPSTTISVNNVAIANGDYLWTGNSSLLWSTTANWMRFDGTNYNLVSTLPTSTVNVFVVSPSDAQQCVSNGNVTINNTNYGVRNISIGSNTQVWLAGTNNLNVTGNWVNLGTFIASTSTVTFNGTGTQTILTGQGSAASNGAKQFKNLTINKASNSRLTLLDNLTVTGRLLVTLGELHVPVSVIGKAEDIRIETAGKLNLAGQLRLND